MTEALHALDRQASNYGLSVQALYFQDMLRQSQGGPLVFASGISAMPSMHVAMATLFVIGGFQKSRRLGYFFLCYAVLIWIASIHLGWHYAADGILGALMMTSLWLVSAPIARLIAFGVRAAAPAKQLQTS
jgi:membrane-associated phospholipid phosphatase